MLLKKFSIQKFLDKFSRASILPFGFKCLTIIIFSCLFINFVYFTNRAKAGAFKQSEQIAGEKALNLSTDIKVSSEPIGYADLVEKLLPAVVNVSTSGTEEVLGNPFAQFFGKGFVNDDLLSQFFGGRNTVKRKTGSLGSAFFIDSNGSLVTNYHVIKDANDITITTQDKEEFKANIIAVDKKSDLAVLKVKTNKKTPYVSFGSSGAMRIGEPVIAIGNPYNFGGTVTSGILSAKSRRIGGSYDDFIQIDAAINSGNSGGPTFNIKGEVIGINTVIVSSNGGNIGLGFAISSDMAVPIINKLKDGRAVKRSVIGVMVQPVNTKIAEAVGLPKVFGALVADVVKDGPADKAGIKKGDIIISFNKKEIKDYSDLTFMVSSYEIGKSANLEIVRYGKTINLKVSTKDHDDDSKEVIDEKEVDISGFVVRALSNDIREKLALPKDIKGVLVVKITNDNLLEQGEIEAGDVITQINDIEINKVSDFKRSLNAIKTGKRKNAIFHIYRNGLTAIYAMGFE
jgi:serine protease Do